MAETMVDGPGIAVELRIARRVIDAARLVVDDPSRAHLAGLRGTIVTYDAMVETE